jgi:modification methylase
MAKDLHDAPVLPLDRVIEGDCVAAMAGLRRPRLRRPALQPAAQGHAAAARQQPGRRRGRRLGPFRLLRELRRLHARLARRGRRVLKPDGAIWVIGSYHNVFRLGAALQDLGFWIQRRDLAQVEPDAELPRQALHQRARDADLGGALGRLALHLQLRRDEGAERRPADALRLADPALHRRRAAEGRSGDKLHPTQKPEALLHRVLVATTAPATSCSTPSSAPARRERSRAARPPLHRHRARARLRAAALRRIAAVDPLDAEALATTRAEGAPSRGSPSANWSSAGCSAPARRCSR